MTSAVFIRFIVRIVVVQLCCHNVHSLTRKELLDSLINKKSYDPSIPPDFDEDKPTLVTVQVKVQDLYSISETAMEYSIDCVLRQWWVDDRLNYANSSINATRLELDTKLIGNIWQPDLYFPNEKRASVHTVTNTNKLLHIHRNGTVVYSMRVALTLTCTMLLHYFPFDSQTCTLQISSYGYTTDNLDLSWKSVNALKIPPLEMAQFHLSQDFTTSEYPKTSETGIYTVLEAKLLIDRKTGYYLLQVIIPSILLVILSWFSFWVDPKAVPARVSLGVTCVLTMTTQSSGVRQTLPPVSYVKAIDVWMLVCLLFVFGALLEFAYVNVTIRKIDKYKPEGTNEADHENAAEGASKENESKLRMIVKLFLPSKGEKYQTDYAARAKRADKISRLAFPVVFIVFMLIFFCVCLLAPDPKAPR